LFGPKYEQRSSENGRDRYLIDGCWYEEDEIELPFGWKRGFADGNRRFYFNEYRKEFSYKLPGADDKPLSGNYSNEDLKASFEKFKARTENLKACIEDLEVRIDNIDYHLHNREVVGRLEKAIAYYLMKQWGIVEGTFYEHIRSLGINFPRSNHSLNLHQLLNPPHFEGICGDLGNSFRDSSQIFHTFKKESHGVVHQQVLTTKKLEKIMDKIFEMASLNDNKPNPYLDSILWVYQNETEYLKDGNIDHLRHSSNEFPHNIIFPRLDG